MTKKTLLVSRVAILTIVVTPQRGGYISIFQQRLSCCEAGEAGAKLRQKREDSAKIRRSRREAGAKPAKPRRNIEICPLRWGVLWDRDEGELVVHGGKCVEDSVC